MTALTLTVASASGRARADGETSGFSLDRYEPAEAGSDWFGLDSLDLRGTARPAVGLTMDYAHKPLVLFSDQSGEVAPLVRYQAFVHAGAAVVLLDRVRVGFSAPVLVAQDGTSSFVDGTTFPAPGKASFGDLRFGADLRLFGEYGGPITAAIGGQVWLPTGTQAQYAGDGSLRASPHLALAGDLGPVAYALEGGYRYRGLSREITGTQLGSEILYGAGVGLRAGGGRILVGAEALGGTALGSKMFERPSSPLEVTVGAHANVSGWRLGLGGGPGLTDAFGSPVFRILAQLAWMPPREAPPPPRLDRDRDGVFDDEDACPDVPGVRTDDPATNGCPKPEPEDRDKDGILDEDDACPDVPGVKTDNPATNGCPLPKPKDRDKDGILDEDDACPDDPGPASDDPKKNGCPVAHIDEAKKQIVIIEQVKFKTASAEILPESTPILDAVREILEGHPEIKQVSIEGHTDHRGGRAYNLKLSDRRAASVAKWLAGHGIDRARLSSKGFGFDQPIDSNLTDAGRRNNRRVEFHIQEAP